MIVYSNKILNFEIEDLDNLEISFEPYIYTNSGIYTKYKKHYYRISENNVFMNFDYKDINFLSQKHINKINKQEILTSIPYESYYVNRKIIKGQLTDNLYIVKEIDNDNYENIYFTNDDIDLNEDSLEIICSYLK